MKTETKTDTSNGTAINSAYSGLPCYADVICPLEIMISGKDKPYYPVDNEIIIDNVEFTVFGNRCNETRDSKRQEIKIILKTWK